MNEDNIDDLPSDCNQPRLRIVKLFTFAKGQAPWSWEVSLVHSVIAFRNRIGFSPTLLELERETRLNRRTITKALDVLKNHGVQRIGNRYDAGRPEATQEGTIGPYRYIGSTKDHWSDRVSYLKTLLPNRGATVNVNGKSKRFTMTHAYLLALLHSIKTQQTKNGEELNSVLKLNNGRIKALSNLNHETIHDGLKLLHHAKLIKLQNWDRTYQYEMKLADPIKNPIFMDVVEPKLDSVTDVDLNIHEQPEPVEVPVVMSPPKMTVKEFNSELAEIGIAEIGRSPTADKLWDRTQQLGFTRLDLVQFRDYCSSKLNEYGNDYTGITQAMLGESSKLLGGEYAA